MNIKKTYHKNYLYDSFTILSFYFHYITYIWPLINFIFFIDIILLFHTYDRDAILRVFNNFRFLSCKSQIGTARHFFSRSVNGTSSGSSMSWINARMGRVKPPPVTSVFQDTVVSSFDEVAPRWLPMIANHDSVVLFSSFGESCCSFDGLYSSSSKESFWKETAQQRYVNIIFLFDYLLSISNFILSS